MSKYTDEEREKLCEKFLIYKYKTVNLMPYKFELRNYDETKSIVIDSPSFNEVKVDGEWLHQLHITHYPSFRELYDAVNNFLANEGKRHGLTLDDIKLEAESHYLEDGSFEEIQVLVDVPLSVEEIDAKIEEIQKSKREWAEHKEKEAKRQEAEEKKLLEELKAKYE